MRRSSEMLGSSECPRSHLAEHLLIPEMTMVLQKAATSCPEAPSALHLLSHPALMGQTDERPNVKCRGLVSLIG